MEEEKTYTLRAAHKHFALALNQVVWGLLEKTNRTIDDNDLMMQAAYASCYHWREMGTAVNQQRGQWLISHVFSVLGRGEPALYHARKCIDITNTAHLTGFDLAYAFEALARAYAVVGEKSECDKNMMLAEKAGEQIEDKDDRTWFFKDLLKEPWYGMVRLEK
jgi:hypothetical protein